MTLPPKEVSLAFHTKHQKGHALKKFKKLNKSFWKKYIMWTICIIPLHVQDGRVHWSYSRVQHVFTNANHMWRMDVIHNQYYTYTGHLQMRRINVRMYSSNTTNLIHSRIESKLWWLSQLMFKSINIKDSNEKWTEATLLASWER